MSINTTEIAPIVERLDAISAELATITERQRRQDELWREMAPIARQAMATAIGELDALDRKGAFAFAAELAGVGRRILEGFSPDDVRQLGEAVVGILDTVRTLTQPDVLRVAGDAAAALHDADSVEPIGLFGMVRATRSEDVQKGLALLVELLRRIGRGVDRVAARQEKHIDRKARLAEMLGPRRAAKKVPGVERPALPPACAAPAAPDTGATVIDGVAFTSDGYLLDPFAWTRPLAEGIAQLERIALGPQHWAVLEAARSDFTVTHVSPNIRRLTQIAGVSTKELYRLFPKAPGRTIARIAGLPKPAGCL